MEWRDKHPHPGPGSLLLGSLVDRARIIGTVSHERGYPIIDLVQEIGHPCTVRSTAVGQVGSKDLAGVCINCQVEFPPDPSFGRLSQVSNVNPETCGINEQVDRPICGKPAEASVTELLQSPGQCRVIGDGKLYL